MYVVLLKIDIRIAEIQEQKTHNNNVYYHEHVYPAYER